MGDYNDDGRQEYIPASRLSRQALQRPLSAHHAHNRIPAAPAQLAKAQTFGSPGNGRRIQSAVPFRNRPATATHGGGGSPTLAAWGESSAPHMSSPRAGGLYGMGTGGGGGGLFTGMDPGPNPHRTEHTRIASRVPEAMDEEMRRMRVTLAGLKDQNRLLRTDRQRLEEELGRARTNLVKAEEILNVREKALSPTIGLSQMYRTPETTALVTKLKEQVRGLRAEKERFKGDLEELLRGTKATRVAELQSEAHALSQELSRQMEMTAVMRHRMEDAEAMAAAAQRKAEAAEALAREYTDAGSVMPPPPARLAPGNTLASGRVRKTMVVMQQAHRALASQAGLLRAVFPPGLSMEQLAARAALKAPTAGATEVLRFLRHHINKMATELNGLPGGRMDPEDLGMGGLEAISAGGGGGGGGARNGSSPPNGQGRPPRPRATRPHSAGPGPVGSGPADGSRGPPEPSSDPRVLLGGTADLVRQLRAMDMDGFMALPDLEADVEQLADVATLLIAEHKRLTGAVSQPVFADSGEEQDVSSSQNPLYQPVPAADPELVPQEEETYDDDFAADGYEEVDVDSPTAKGKDSSNQAKSDAEEEEEEEVAEEEEEDEDDRSEVASAKPSLLKESSSQRSSRSAPDTPQKQVEAPASSVGDPAEYGSVVRSSVAGSAYGGSTRGWTPEGDPVKEASEKGDDKEEEEEEKGGSVKKAGSEKRSSHHSGSDAVVGEFEDDDDDLGEIAGGLVAAVDDDDDEEAHKAPAAADEPEADENDFGNVGGFGEDEYDMSYKKKDPEPEAEEEDKEDKEEKKPAPQEDEEEAVEEEAKEEPEPVVADVSEFAPADEDDEENVDVAAAAAAEEEEDLSGVGALLAMEAAADEEEAEVVELSAGGAAPEVEVAEEAEPEDVFGFGSSKRDEEPEAKEEEEAPVKAAEEEDEWWNRPAVPAAAEEEEDAPAAAKADDDDEEEAPSKPAAEEEDEWWNKPARPSTTAEDEPVAAPAEEEEQPAPAPKVEEEADDWWNRPAPTAAAEEEEESKPAAVEPEPEPEIDWGAAEPKEEAEPAPAAEEDEWWNKPARPSATAEDEPAAAPAEEEEEPALAPKVEEEADDWWNRPAPTAAAEDEEEEPKPAAAQPEPEPEIDWGTAETAREPEPEADPVPAPAAEEDEWWNKPARPSTTAEDEPVAASAEEEEEPAPAPKVEEEADDWWNRPAPTAAAEEEEEESKPAAAEPEPEPDVDDWGYGKRASDPTLEPEVAAADDTADAEVDYGAAADDDVPAATPATADAEGYGFGEPEIKPESALAADDDEPEAKPAATEEEEAPAAPPPKPWQRQVPLVPIGGGGRYAAKQDDDEF